MKVNYCTLYCNGSDRATGRRVYLALSIFDSDKGHRMKALQGWHDWEFDARFHHRGRWLASCEALLLDDELMAFARATERRADKAKRAAAHIVSYCMCCA